MGTQSATPQVSTRVTIRFAGDSGDGMQLTGGQFTKTSALLGNDLATLPDYPAEIRAPAGTIAGVSGFQVQFGSTHVFTCGDRPDVLVAMNPAALKANIVDLDRGATIVLNADAFTRKLIEKAGFDSDPRENGSLESYNVLQVPITSMTLETLKDSALAKKDRERSKNFYALGLTYWMYSRSLDSTIAWINQKFAKKPDVIDANLRTLQAGYNYGLNTEAFANTYVVESAKLPAGQYRQITGNQATAWGFIAASKLSGLDLFLGSYPITPASDILHELSKHKNMGVRTVQAEDEIAAVCAAIGASYGGHLAITTTSGPGLALKTEAIGLASMVEIPLVVINVQRGGPSTGLPTKTEQSDLLQAMYGRNGESTLPVVAASTPSGCFATAIEAARIAIKYRTPVIMLSDGYIANGAEPWRIPSVDSLHKITPGILTEPPEDGFMPYARDEQTLARPWVIPGTPHMEHRVGGLEKDKLTGEVSYDPQNHEHMNRIRAAKVAGIDVPDAVVGGELDAEVLLVGWGGTFGTLRAATLEGKPQGVKIAHVHVTHINPLPANFGDIIAKYKHVVVAELNLGQFAMILNARYGMKVHQLNKMQGLPFRVYEVIDFVKNLLAEGGAK